MNGSPERRPRYFVRVATKYRHDMASMNTGEFVRARQLSASQPDESVEAGGFGRIGQSHALLGNAKSKVAPISRAITEETGMDQKANANETRPSQGALINELFARHYRGSLRTAYKILRSKEDAEDAVQNAYCAAFRNFNKFRGESSFKTWITRIVVNCCLTRFRDHHSGPLLALDDILPTLASRAATPEALCYLRELEAAHTKAASKLPENLKNVYARCLVAGVAFPAVAHQLGLTTAAAKSRLFRARRKVEESLQSVVKGRAA